MTVAPDAPYTKTPGEVYQARLDGLVGQVHRLADELARVGQPSTSVATLRPDHVDAAVRVQRVLLRNVEQLRLDSLTMAAVAADHPDANYLPGVMLDVAAAAAEVALEAVPDTAHTRPAAYSTEVAEAVLRAVGLLR